MGFDCAEETSKGRERSYVGKLLLCVVFRDHISEGGTWFAYYSERRIVEDGRGVLCWGAFTIRSRLVDN